MGRVVFIEERSVEGGSTGGESSVYSREKCGRCGALVWSSGGESSVYSREKSECGRYGALVGRVVFIRERNVEGVEHWWGE